MTTPVQPLLISSEPRRAWWPPGQCAVRCVFTFISMGGTLQLLYEKNKYIKAFSSHLMKKSESGAGFRTRLPACWLQTRVLTPLVAGEALSVSAQVLQGSSASVGGPARAMCPLASERKGRSFTRREFAYSDQKEEAGEEHPHTVRRWHCEVYGVTSQRGDRLQVRQGYADETACRRWERKPVVLVSLVSG